ncbi:MAG: CvpA family protein [Gallionellaceae bacterium]|jgi:membrane protein required for colicin V production
MTQFDYIILVIIVLSVLLGWWRGLVYEVLSLLSWITAYFVARSWVTEFVPYMPSALESETLRIAASFVFLFITTLILCGIAAWALYKLIKSFGLDWRTDGVSGAIFGFFRGLMVVLLLVLVAGLSKLPQTSFWHDALLSKPLQNVALLVKDFLPEDMAKRVSF